MKEIINTITKKEITDYEKSLLSVIYHMVRFAAKHLHDCSHEEITEFTRRNLKSIGYDTMGNDYPIVPSWLNGESTERFDELLERFDERLAKNNNKETENV